MSLYTAAIKTHVIDPVRDIARARTEFRFPQGDHVFLANMRLMNLGVDTVTSTAALNALTGTYGIIKQIALYDGSVLLDQVLVGPQLMGFKLYNKSNDKSRDESKFLACNNLGFSMQGVDAGAGQAQITQYLSPPAADTTDDTTALGWLSLRAVFPFLAESQYVPTNIYKNPRLVVQYDLTNARVIPDGTDNVLEQAEPLLVVDELVDEALAMNVMQSYMGVQYRSIEHDRVIVPAGAPTAGNPSPTQNANFVINGFDNKTVNRILMVNTPRRNQLNALTGGLESVAMRGQRTQWRVNGANRLPRDGDGWNRPNQRLAHLADTWGECNAPVVGHIPGLDDSANVVAAGAAPLVGALDYSALIIGDRVRELQLSYTRVNEYDAAAPGGDQGQTIYNQELELNIYGEVEKTVALNGRGGYNVRYV